LALRRLYRRRNVGAIRENWTPAEGVAARYEDKETALCKGREAGGANYSPRGSGQAKSPSPEIQPRQGQRRQRQNPEKTEVARPGQDPDCGQTKDGKEAGHSKA